MHIYTHIYLLLLYYSGIPRYLTLCFASSVFVKTDSGYPEDAGVINFFAACYAEFVSAIAQAGKRNGESLYMFISLYVLWAHF